MRISVIGHRSVSDRSKVIEAAAAAFREIVGDPAGGAAFDLMSSLADGADRLAVEAASRWPGMKLIAVLPLPRADYARDFDGPDSREEFDAALRRAAEVVELTPDGTRSEAYRRAGRYLVDHCDHLIALWDGNSSGLLGGTADTLAYAREHLDPARIHAVIVERGQMEARS